MRNLQKTTWHLRHIFCTFVGKYTHHRAKNGIDYAEDYPIQEHLCVRQSGHLGAAKCRQQKHCHRCHVQGRAATNRTQ